MLSSVLAKMDGVSFEGLDQEVPYEYPQTPSSYESCAREKSKESKSKTLPTGAKSNPLGLNLVIDSQELFQDLSQMQDQWIQEAKKEDQFVPEIDQEKFSQRTAAAVKAKPKKADIKAESQKTEQKASCCLIKSEPCELQQNTFMNIASPRTKSLPPTSSSNTPERSRQGSQSYTNLASSVTPFYMSASAGSSLPTGPQPVFALNRSENVFHSFPNRDLEPCSIISPLPQSSSSKHDQLDISYRELFRRRADHQRMCSAQMQSTSQSDYFGTHQTFSEGYDASPINVFEDPFSELRFKYHHFHGAPRLITYKEHAEHKPYHRRGLLQLWQFLVALLSEPDCQQYISWTGRGLEFKLVDPEEIARRWGIQKNRPAMNYDKLSRSLRYYYEKGIMQKVAGERYVYRFVCSPEALFNLAFPDGMRPLLKPECHQPNKVTDQQIASISRNHYDIQSYISKVGQHCKHPAWNKDINCIYQ